MTPSTKAVTRETSAWVRDKGMRAVIATLTDSVIELRAKGLRSREYLDLAWCYEFAVKARIARERSERKAKRKGGKA